MAGHQSGIVTDELAEKYKRDYLREVEWVAYYRARVAALEGALRKYGQHDWVEDVPEASCASYEDGPGTCTCGLAAALEGTR